MDVNAWNSELSLFAVDVFAYLMSRHPLLYKLPLKRGGSPYFTGEIGKCIMLKFHEIRNELDRKLRSDFPRFVKREDVFKQYLKLFVDAVMQSEQNAISQVFGLSAVLLGVICFVHRRGMTYFVHDAANYLFYMLLSVKPEEFYEKGGWPLLESESAKLIEGYDEEEICREYLLQNVCNFSTSCSTMTCKSSSPLKYSAKITGITEKNFQGVVSIYHEPSKESENYSASEQEAYRSPSILKKEPVVTPSSELGILESNNLTGESPENNEYLSCPKLYQLPQTEEESQNISEPVKASKKVCSLKDSSFQASLKLKTPQTNLESLEESTDRKMPDGRAPSMDDLSKSTAECVKGYVEDFVEPKDCLHEPLQVETSTTDSEFNVDQFLIDHITSHFQVRFLTKEEIKAMKVFSEDIVESTSENSAQHKSPTDKVTNNADKPKTNVKDSAKENVCGVNKLIQGEVSQTGLGSINNDQEKSEKENIDNIEVRPAKFPTNTEHACGNGSAKIKCSSHLKSPKVETSKKVSPDKAKNSSSEKCGIRDAKIKISAPKNDGTPRKAPTTGTPKSSSLVTSSERHKTETQKNLKSVSAEPMSRSPTCLKTPTERGLPKFQSKSSEKTERGRRLSLPKASPETTKHSASVANAKSCVKNIPATDSSKPLTTAVSKSKSGAKDFPSHQLKPSSTTSASISKCKVAAKECPLSFEKTKRNLQASNTKTENMESISLENAAGSSSVKSTEPTESKPDTSSKEFLDTRCAETKGNKHLTESAKSTNHSNTGRTRNPRGKSASVDFKNPKPRWR